MASVSGSVAISAVLIGSVARTGIVIEKSSNGDPKEGSVKDDENKDSKSVGGFIPPASLEVDTGDVVGAALWADEVAGLTRLKSSLPRLERDMSVDRSCRCTWPSVIMERRNLEVTSMEEESM